MAIESRDDHFVYLASAEADTARLGAALASTIRPGDVIALNGELGAGKTRLVQGLAAALGCDRQAVNSPTFALIQEYDGALPVYHFDVYRLRDTDEFLELGADELLHGEGVCLIEWAARVADALPRDRLTIEISATGPESRLFFVEASGERSREMMVAAERALIAPPLDPEPPPPA